MVNCESRSAISDDVTTTTATTKKLAGAGLVFLKLSADVYSPSLQV